MPGRTMEFSELSINTPESPSSSTASVRTSSPDPVLQEAGLQQGSFAELAAEIYGVLGESGNMTGKTLRPLSSLLPNRTSTVSDHDQNHEEAAARPAFLMELLNVLGANPNDFFPLHEAKMPLPAALESTIQNPARPQPASDRSLPQLTYVRQAPISNQLPPQVSSATSTPGSQAGSSTTAPKVEAVSGSSSAEARAPVTAAPVLTMVQVIESALRALSILKLKVSSVTSVARSDDGWRVSVELVERAGVPDMNDVLGLYELQLDQAGNVLTYERTHMRRRCDLCR